MNIDSIYWKIKNYFEGEKDFDFSGWEDVEIFFGDTLVNALIKARPNDFHKFENKEFTKRVLSANGKWLEKQSENDKYKIIIATRNCITELTI